MYLTSYTKQGANIRKILDREENVVIPAELDQKISPAAPIVELSCCCCVFGKIVSLSFSSPSNVNLIGNYAFAHCLSLKSVKFPNSLIEIKIGAFLNCTALETVEFEENSKLEIIGNKAFMKCSSLKSFIFPHSLTKIGSQAFQACKQLENGNLYDTNVRSIGMQAFNFTKIQKFIFPKCFEFSLDNLRGLSFIHEKVQFSAETKHIAIDPCGTMYFVPQNGLVTIPKKIKNSLIREGTEHLYEYSIYQSKIRMQVIPSSVQEIHESACSGLLWKTLRFGKDSQLKTIGNRAFNGSYITKIIFPKSLEVIGERAFFECDCLRFVKFPHDSELKRIEFAVFDGTLIKKLFLPSRVDDIQPGAFLHMKDLSYLSIHSEKYQSKLGGIIFSLNADMLVFALPLLKEIVIPESVEIIGENAFSESRIKYIHLPKSVRRIEKCAFANKGLKEITFASNSMLEEICDGAFAETYVEKLDLPSSIKKIHRGALYEMYELHSVNINNDFYHTDKRGIVYATNPPGIVFVPRTIGRIDIENGIEEIYDFSISVNKNIICTKIPSTVKYIGHYGIGACINLERVSFALDSQITHLCDGIFYKAKIKSIFIPASVEKIDSPLLGCSILEEIHFQRLSKLKSISNSFFKTLHSLRVVYLPKSILHLFLEFDLKNVKFVVFDI